jgi:hypothetical protein
MTYVQASNCPPNQPCIYGDGPETDGDHAAYFSYAAGSGSSTGPGPSPCLVYVFEDSSGWKFLDGYCTQNLLATVGGSDSINTPGSCANLRNQPGVSGTIIRCIADQTIVKIDQGPTWLDGHLWWHVGAGGWIAHDNLFGH